MDERLDTRSPGDVMRAMVVAFDTGDTGGLGDFMHTDYVDHQGLGDDRPLHGIDGFRRVVETAREGYLELSVTIADLIEGRDRAAARIVWTGTRPSGELVQREGIDIVRVDAGRAVEHWGGR